MDKFYLIVNGEKDTGFLITNKVLKYLQINNKECDWQAIYPAQPDQRYVKSAKIPSDTQCIIVLGGDGTLIQTARSLASYGIPFVGINLGTLGYLTEADKESVTDMLDCLIKDEYVLEKRMMLYGRIYRNDEILSAGIALNDIVISRGNALRILRFKVFVNDEFLNLYAADGMIYATPTGSTAYNMSAGGPIISPNATMIAMTPICAHTLNSGSIILSPDDHICLEICGDAREGSHIVVFDGDKVVEIELGDRVEIKRSELEITMIKLSRLSFFQSLRKKMADV